MRGTAKIYKTDYGYKINFLGKELNFKNEKEAKEKAIELNYDYFSQHTDKLPKGIIVDAANKRFRFFIRLDNKTLKHIKSSKDLNKLIEVRNHILKNLLDLF